MQYTLPLIFALAVLISKPQSIAPAISFKVFLNGDAPRQFTAHPNTFFIFLGLDEFVCLTFLYGRAHSRTHPKVNYFLPWHYESVKITPSLDNKRIRNLIRKPESRVNGFRYRAIPDNRLRSGIMGCCKSNNANIRCLYGSLPRNHSNEDMPSMNEALPRRSSASSGGEGTHSGSNHRSNASAT